MGTAARGGPEETEPTARARVSALLKVRGFRHFLAARLVSQLGDGIFQLSAAAVLLFEHPGHNPAVALFSVSAVTLVPFSMIGPFTGVFIDRWDRRRILEWVPVLRGATAALLPAAAVLGTHSGAFYLVVLVVLSVNRFFLATMSAVLPQLVARADLLVANSVSTTGGAVANVAGQGIGAALAALIGGRKAALSAAVAIAGAALFTRALKVHRGHGSERAPLMAELRSVMSEMREGVRTVRASRPVVYGLSAIGIVQVLVGAMVGVLVYFFIHVLGLKVGAATGILAVLAIGIGAGVVMVPVVARRVRRELIIAGSFVIAAFGCSLAAFTLSRTTLIIGAGIVGISYAFAKIPVDTTVQEEIDDASRGRAFAVYDMLFNLARVGGIGIAALLYEAGARSAPIVAGIAGCYAIGAIGFMMWRRDVQET